MTPQIRLHKRQVTDWQSIRDIGEDDLRQAIEKLGALSAAPLLPGKIQSVLADSFKNGKHLAEPLLRQVLALYGVVRQLNLTPQEVFDGLHAGLQSESNWTTEEFERWAKILPLLQQLFGVEVIRLSAKALDLAYEHSELLQRARILTDIRPVFNDDASKLTGSVISHSLLLRYDDIGGNRVLSLALDEDDIISLKEQCERSLKKSKTARLHLESGNKIPTLVPGNEENE